MNLSLNRGLLQIFLFHDQYGYDLFQLHSIVSYYNTFLTHQKVLIAVSDQKLKSHIHVQVTDKKYISTTILMNGE